MIGRATTIAAVLAAASVALITPTSAHATAMTSLATFSGSELVTVDQPGSGTPLLIRAFPGSWPSTLYSLSPFSTPVELARSPYLAGAAISTNGRFEVWVNNACNQNAGPKHTISVNLVDTSMISGTPRKLTVPSRYARAQIDAINVSSSGRVNMLVATYNTHCAGFSSASAGDQGAVLSTPPGASGFQVIASAVLHGPAPHGGATDLGQDVASPAATTFALCSDLGNKSLKAELVDVATGNTVTIRRTTIRTFARGGMAECSASDSGAAVMVTSGPHQQELTTLGDGSPHHVFASGSGPLLGPVISPSGRKAAYGGIVNLTTGYTQHVALPSGLRGSGYAALTPGRTGQVAFEPGVNFLSDGVSWDGLQSIVASLRPDRGRAYESALDVRTGKWMRPLYFESSPGQHGSSWCQLSTGRILIGIGDFPRETWRLYLSDPGRTHFARINTQSIGPVTGVSCPISGTSVYVSAGSQPAKLLVASAAAVDGSAWTP